MSKKLISVIVPIYNVGDYLEQCIKTIIQQTYENVEIILVDDGSTDNCSEICDYYKKLDNRIKVIHKKNGGLSSARNAGLEICLGDYIAFIDSDDYVAENYLEELFNMITENDADIAIANRYELKGNEVIIPKFYLPVNKTLISSQKLLEMFYYDILPHEAWGKLYKRKIFDNYKYKENLKVYEDIEFITRILLKEKLTINCDTSKCLYYYRDREDSIMKEGFNSLWNDEIIFYQQIYEKVTDNSLKKAIANMEIKKCIRNLNKITNVFNDTELVNNTLNIIKYNLNNIKIKHLNCAGKKNKIKLFLLRNNLSVIKLLLKIKNSKKKKYYNHFLSYVKKQRKNGEPLNLIFNGPYTGNLGDHAILFGEEEYLKKQEQEPFCISAIEMPVFFETKAHELVKIDDNIYITGGGNIGTLWRNEQQRMNKVLETFKNNKIIIFPQTIYYSDDEFGKICLNIDKKYYNNCKNLKFYCREKKSYEYAKNILNVNCELKKDMALTLDYRNKKYKRRGIIFCFRNDKEKKLSQNEEKAFVEKIKQKYPKEKITYIDTLKVNRKLYTYKQGKKEFKKIIKQFSKSKLVVTDRLHGMILSVITGTNCIAFDNSSGKVSGVYDTIKDDDVNVEFIENYNNI